MCIWTYWVRADAEEEFLSVIAGHWPALNRLGFVTDDPPLLLRSSQDPPVYVQIMTWEAGGMRPAHEHPDVIEIWEAAKQLVEERADRHAVPGMSFPFYRRVEIPV